jgi:ribonuclease P protein component
VRWYASLRRSADFTRLRRRGRRADFPAFTAYTLAGRGGAVRVGITIPRAVGTAVVRNLLRRRIRGALDRLAPEGPGMRSADLLFAVRPEAVSAGYAALASDVASVASAVMPARSPAELHAS